MMSNASADSLWVQLRGRQRKPAIVLTVSTLSLSAWWYYGSPQFYLERLSGTFVWFGDPQATAAVYSFLAAAVLMGVVPLTIVKFVFHESPADYGVRLGNRVRTLRSMLIFAPIMVAIAYFSSGSPAMRSAYPINPHAGGSSSTFALHVVTYLLYYLGWEFQFRGFMQHGLRESFGDVGAILVQTMASVLVHLGKPPMETFAALAAGILWGIFAIRTRSLLSGLVQHALLGITLDWFVCYR